MDCWQTTSAENCPPLCSYTEGGTDPCAGARIVDQTLVTPFAAQPEMMAAVDVVYESMYDVSVLLNSSTLGRRVRTYGNAVSDEMVRVVTEDSELWSRAFQTLMKALRYARAMERERQRPGATSPQHRFTEEDFAFGAIVADDIRARTKDPALIAALDDMREEAARFVGLSPAEMLNAFSDGTTRVRIRSLKQLQEMELDVLNRLRAMANGERLFLAHPLRALSDAGFDLSDDAVAEILRLHPNLAEMPTTAYDALKASPIEQSGTIRLVGLFNWEQR